MKVLHVVSGLESGGAEQALVRLIDGLEPQGVHASVVSLRGKGFHGPALEARGVPVHALGLRPSTALLGWPRLRAILHREQPELVHGWMYHGALAARIAAGGRPVVWGIRHSLVDLSFEKPGTRAVIRLGARLSSGVDRIVYNSEVARAQHRALGYAAGRDAVIGNGFPLVEAGEARQHRQRVRAALGIGAEAFVVGHVARFHPMKDHRGFLQAVAALAPDPSTLRVLLVGRGMDAGNPALRAQSLPEGVVHALGERSDVAELLCACDVLCLSSRWGEAFPNVVGEAMACGVPCVVTDVGDSAAIVGETGWVVPPGNPDLLAAALRAAKSLSPEARMHRGSSARERVRSRFSLASVAARHLRLYGSLV